MSEPLGGKPNWPYQPLGNWFLLFAFLRLQTVKGNEKQAACWRAGLRGLLTLALAGSVLLMTELPARAYTDPGSGLLTLQMLGAWLAGGIFYVRYKLNKILRRKANKTANPDSLPTDADGQSSRQEPAG
jgi:hypothetical protein